MKLEIQKIEKRYGKKQVLKGVSFTLCPGECVGILGANGSGKSTLLSILAGVQKPNGGAFLQDTQNLFTAPKQRERLVGYVPQGTPLMDELTARDNLLLWYSKKEMNAQLQEGFLKTLGIGEFLDTTVSKLSGGMKKRLSIGCAVHDRPQLLIMDEPMAALDLVCKQTIADFITRRKREGGMVLLASHDLLEISLCDRLFILKEGILTPFTYNGNVESLVSSL